MSSTNHPESWAGLHAKYKSEDWIDKPNVFAVDAVKYFPPHGRVLDLGAGQGQDSRYFSDHGYNVVATDIEPSALAATEAKLTIEQRRRVKTQPLDLREPFPFADASFDVVYAHLSLHYFTNVTTEQVLREIARVLRPKGILAFFVNSVDDPEYGTGKQIEDHFFDINGTTKRFFTAASAHQVAKPYFSALLSDNRGETYKDAAKGVHHLVRYIGRKN